MSNTRISFTLLAVMLASLPLLAKPTITTTSLSSGTVGVAYPPETLTATGATTPYTWSLSGGILPPGLSLSGSGVISGTPTSPGLYKFGVRVTAADATSDTQQLQILINPTAIPPTITTTALPGGTAGTIYPTATLSASGGNPPYTWSISAGSLPPGLTLSASGAITGTPTTAGTYNFTVKVTDAANLSSTQSFQVVIAPAPVPPTITTTSVSGGTVGTAYPQQNLTATGGTPPYTFSITAGSLPPGLTLSSSGAITGTPTTAGTYNFTVKVTDAANLSSTQSFQIVIAPAPVPPTITTTSVSGGTVGTAYPQQNLTATGGTSPYTWSISAGTLPPGLSLSSSGAITGTPTTVGTYSFTVKVTDAANLSSTQSFQVVIAPAPVPPTITTTSVSGGTVGTAYPQQNLTATGGTSPYTWSISAGSLPPGLALSPSGAITGTPTSAGTYSFTVKVTDAANLSSTQSLQIVITAAPVPPTITTTLLPAGTTGTAYPAQTLGATGGTPPYSFSISAGTLPPGLAMSTSGTITGTPTTAGTYNFTATITDSANLSSTQALQIVISAAAVPPTITTTSLPSGTSGTAYPQQTLSASGGKSPYTWSISAGNLPPGLSLSSGGVITGTPTSAGTYSFTAKVTDSANLSGTQVLQIVINAAPVPPTITTTALPAGTAATPYPQQTLGVTGGTAPYTWLVSAGNLPPGLGLSTSGVLSGTPTTAGTYSFTAKVTDAANLSSTQALQIVINPAPTPPGVTTTSLPGGTAGTVYPQQTLGASGGTAPYTWTISSGSLPPGLSLSTGGVLTGTPTTAGTYSFTAKVTDAAGLSGTQALQIIIAAPPTPTITSTAVTSGTVGANYPQQSLAAGGGTPPYSWSISAGSLPPGLSLASNGIISGKPTSAGTFTFTVKVVDANSLSDTKTLQIVISPAPTPPVIVTTSLPASTAGTVYSQQTLTATGGTPPFSWSLAGGTLPPGLTLSTAGLIIGTPSTAGTYSFAVKVTDSAGLSDTKGLQILVNPATPPPAITTTSLPRGIAGVTYTSALNASGGVAPYTWSVSAGTLPAGITLDPSGQLRGTPSAAGTYSITLRVTDSRGSVAERSLTIVVSQALSISSCPAVTAQATSPYAASLTGTGGTPPYTWSAFGQLPPGLALNSSTGILAGTPIAIGAFQFALQITDAANQTATLACTIAITQPFTIVNEALPDATTLAAYSQTLSVAGGTAPFVWTISAGALPPGLVLNNITGALSGVPSAPGKYTFAITATDANSARAERTYTINVGSGFTITSCPAAAGSIGQGYSSAAVAAGGQSPYTWSIVGGSLPAGLSLAADTATITGIPPEAGASSFTVQATDARGTTATKSCTVTIASQLSIVTPAINNASVGSPYAQSVAATGGTAPYSWTVSDGVLPVGLTLNSASGSISGLPTQAGTLTFTLRVSDSIGQTADKPFTITVGSAFLISACPLPSGTVGQLYSSGATVTSGQSTLTWTLVNGALPPGLNLAAATGTISGTPIQAGSNDFSLQAAGDSVSATRACTITVSVAPLTIASPPALPDAVLGTSYDQKLNGAGGKGPFSWTLADGTLPPGISLGGDGHLTGVPTAAGTYTFTARVNDQNQGTVAQVFVLTVLPGPAPVVHFSDLPDIVAPAQQPAFNLALDSGYPVPLKGRLTLKFTPDPAVGVDDKSIRFVTGARTMDFDIPANSTQPVFAVPQPALQTGTVAGTIDLTVQLFAGSVDVTPSPAPARSMRIDRTAPVIASVEVATTADGFQISVTGFSTTREVSMATFQFTPAAGSRLNATQVSVPTADAARTWFNDARSANYGGQFTLVQPFTVRGATLSDVSVTLTNAQGTSQPVRAKF